MALKELVDGLAGAISKARARLDEVNQRISELETDQHNILLTPPHTDDIVAAFKRGLTDAGQDFERRLAWYLNDENATGVNASNALNDKTAHLLSVAKLKPSWKSLIPPSKLGIDAPNLDFAAITYFLRDQIAAEIPSLVAKLCPAADGGLKSDEREKLLSELSEKLKAMHAERDELTRTLDAARIATGGSSE
ncbi:hypothetical protein [Pontixanthobacter sp.]|uniref:hypothetical protein n=1 Tax=Pontixanthobacter sp. TaxID=2792078 RepID=UPI003C7D1B01